MSVMKRWGLLALTAVWLPYVPVWAEEVSAKPKLAIEQPEFNFGTVSQGTKVSYDFVVRNGGTADLQIQRLVPACGCTAASASSEPIKPNEDGKIHVEFDTSGFSGEKLKTVRVYSNDADNPSQLLTLKGTIEPDVVVEPRSVFFEEVVRGGEAGIPVKDVVVTVREGSKVGINSVKSNSKYVLVKEIESTPQHRKISISIDPAAPIGELRDRIVVGIKADSSESSINIPVFAAVKGYISLKPGQLSFGVIEGKTPLQRSVRLENSSTTPVLIKELRSNNPAVTAVVKELEPGKKFQIEVSVDPSKVTRDLRASLDVITDNEKEGTLSLNVYGILPPKV